MPVTNLPFDFGTTFVDFEVTESLAPLRATWRVRNSALPWLKDPAEWNQTTVEWQIAAVDGRTAVTMKHHGLTPSVECFEACQKGWNFYVGTSLKELIDTDIGRPDGRVG